MKNNLLRLVFLFLICVMCFLAGWIFSLEYHKKILISKPHPPLSPIYPVETKKLAPPANLPESVEKPPAPKPKADAKPPSSPAHTPQPSKLKYDKHFNKLNWRAFSKVKNKKKYFFFNGEYSFLINVFSREEEALKYIQNLRSKYPSWSLFIKFVEKNFRVYIGPFKTQKKARLFMSKEVQNPQPFPSHLLQKVGIN